MTISKSCASGSRPGLATACNCRRISRTTQSARIAFDESVPCILVVWKNYATRGEHKPLISEGMRNLNASRAGWHSLIFQGLVPGVDRRQSGVITKNPMHTIRHSCDPLTLNSSRRFHRAGGESA
jgi:hypothetical protein